MDIDESLTQEIVRRILTVTRPDRIILFGSAATGKMTRDSDIDLLVVARAPKNTMEETYQVSRTLAGLGFPFDVFVMAAEKFERTKEFVGGLAYPAHKYGRVIYESG